MWTVVTGLFSLALSFISINIPVEGYTWGLESSGTYCFLNLRQVIPTTVYLQVGVFLPQFYLVYNVYTIRRDIKKSQTILKLHGISYGQAKGHYVSMVLKLGYFVVGMCFAYCPTLISAIYAQSTNSYFPPALSALAGLLAITNSAFINPLLFFYLNVDLRENFMNKYEGYVQFFTKFLFATSAKVYPLSSRVINVRAKPTSGKENFVNYNDIEVWLQNPNLFESFKRYGQTNFCTENLAFYEDVIEYQSSGMETRDLVSRYFNLQNEQNKKELLTKWKSLEAHANRIYLVYIKVSCF